MGKVVFIDEVDIKNKTVLLRADFDISLNPNHTIANDARIKQNLPTINYLLKNNNKLICIAKLNRPKKQDPRWSLKIVVKRLREYLPDYKITLVKDFLTTIPNTHIKRQSQKEILVLENIRFYKQEKENSQEFAKKLASLGSIYVNDNFAISHRKEASVVSVPKFLPFYGGLLLKKEIEQIEKAVKNPKKPLVAIIGGAKILTKINLIGKLTQIADYLLIGGALTNTFLCAKGYKIGGRFCEKKRVSQAKNLLALAKKKGTKIILPCDVVIGSQEDYKNKGVVKKVEEIKKIRKNMILDIGPATKAEFGAIIDKAKTIIWNGPVGYIENPIFARGTDFIYYAIAQNKKAVSIVGGGDTLTAISKKEYLDKITHVSTGGGAMLEFIEKGTLAGIEALKKRKTKNKT